MPAYTFISVWIFSIWIFLPLICLVFYIFYTVAFVVVVVLHLKLLLSLQEDGGDHMMKWLN